MQSVRGSCTQLTTQLSETRLTRCIEQFRSRQVELSCSTACLFSSFTISVTLSLARTHTYIWLFRGAPFLTPQMPRGFQEDQRSCKSTTKQFESYREPSPILTVVMSYRYIFRRCFSIDVSRTSLFPLFFLLLFLPRDRRNEVFVFTNESEFAGANFARDVP